MFKEIDFTAGSVDQQEFWDTDGQEHKNIFKYGRDSLNSSKSGINPKPSGHEQIIRRFYQRRGILRKICRSFH